MPARISKTRGRPAAPAQRELARASSPSSLASGESAARPTFRAAAAHPNRSGRTRRGCRGGATRNGLGESPKSPYPDGTHSRQEHGSTTEGSSRARTRSSSRGSLSSVSTDESIIYRPRSFVNGGFSRQVTLDGCSPWSSAAASERACSAGGASRGASAARSRSSSRGSARSRSSSRSSISSAPSTDESIIYRPRSIVNRGALCRAWSWETAQLAAPTSSPAPAAAAVAVVEIATTGEAASAPLAEVLATEIDKASALEVQKRVLTTVLLQCLPLNFTRTSVVKLLEENGFKGKVDFLYMPCHFSTGASFGYAFVNLLNEDEAAKCWSFFSGFDAWEHDRPCTVVWADTQGLAANIERYRNSPLMHPNISDEIRPMLFKGGRRVAFPKPTRKVKPPKTERLRK